MLPVTENLLELLELDDKGLSLTEDGLSYLFRMMLRDLCVSADVWSTLMEAYLDDPRAGVGASKTDRSSKRNGLNRALGKTVISWKKFKNGIRILGMRSCEFELSISKWDDKIDVPKQPPKVTIDSRISQDDLKALIQRLEGMMRITPQTLLRLIEEFINHPISRTTDNPADKSTRRGNINKGYNGESYSWRTFNELLAIFSIREYTLTALVVWKNGKQSKHKMTVDVAKAF
jgi:hypothetical protein